MVDYSKWDHIELSDDEDVTESTGVNHPQDDDEDKKNYLQLNEKRISEIEKLLANHEGNQIELEEQLEQLRKENVELKTPKMDKSSRKSKTTTIYNKSGLNTKQIPEQNTEKTEEERGKEFRTFVELNEKLCREYGLLCTLRDSKCFLESHQELVCQHTSNYLGLWSLNLELAGKRKLVSRVAHQHMIMQYILKLGLTLNVNPRSSIDSFFATIQNCSQSYREQFELEIQSYKEIIRNRAIEKRREVLREYQRQERAERLGPGGLDPLEVLESLPPELKICFEKSDVQMLIYTIASMPAEVGDYHMKRCIDAGLWKPYSEDDDVVPTTPSTNSTL